MDMSVGMSISMNVGVSVEHEYELFFISSAHSNGKGARRLYWEKKKEGDGDKRRV